MFFAELPFFKKAVGNVLSSSELLRVKLELTGDPSRGALIQGSGGIRKLRVAAGGTGKSGGARMLYYLVADDAIILCYIYRKSEKEIPTPTDLRRISKELKRENQ
ncbi:MAG: type II toxin-antitoxin system RelE/ParE family toxin [Verrucomicrobia bacterium]|nr:type II toxin-antitoxin system RelE/ParE family toxin [Verrucomicrobiota bacterium]